jgi:hypothetical protein
MEEWRDIPGYEGWYQVSNFGQVRRMRKTTNTKPYRILKPVLQKTGYLHVSLYKFGKQAQHSIHRLVCMAFHGIPPEGYCVNHKDGNSTNNHASNLEWTSYGGNLQHAYDVLDRPRNSGQSHGMSKLQDKDATEIRRLYETGQYTQRKIADMFGVGPDQISRIVTRSRWRHV